MSIEPGRTYQDQWGNQWKVVRGYSHPTEPTFLAQRGTTQIIVGSDGKPRGAVGRLRVVIGYRDYAPDGEHYYATLHGLDLDVAIGHGKTPLEAVADLLWRIDGLEDIDPESCDLVYE